MKESNAIILLIYPNFQRLAISLFVADLVCDKTGFSELPRKLIAYYRSRHTTQFNFSTSIASIIQNY